MGYFSDLDIDRQDAEGVWCCFADMGIPARPLAGWTAVIRTLNPGKADA